MRSGTFVAFVSALLVLGAVEGAARLTLDETVTGWDYWTRTAANKFVTYFGLRDEGRTPEVLIVGDSSADYGFSPEAFDAALHRDRLTYNLATLGNFPLSFDRTVNDLVLAGEGPLPRYVLIIFTRGAFERRERPRASELGILGSPVVKRSRGEHAAGDFLFLSRLWPARMQLLDAVRGRNDEAARRERGYQARRDASGEDITRPTEARRFVVDPARMAVLERAFEICDRRGIQAILVHPPIHSYERLQWTNPDAYTRAAADLARRYGAPFWDYSQTSRFDAAMRDLVHLDADGAAAFSEELARRFRDYAGAGASDEPG